MDFYRIKERSVKKDTVEVYPDFRVCRSKDLMVRGRSFYAVWDEAVGLWSTDEYDVQRLMDEELTAYREQMGNTDGIVKVAYMGDFSTGSWRQFRNYMMNVSDNSQQLDTKLTFANTKVVKSDYVSRRLPYSLEEGPTDAWDELIGTLYDPEERDKLEWAIGAIVSGDAKDIQKFLVLYGAAGAGKSTILNVIQKLFVGYYTTFEAKALTSTSNAFSTEVFKSNPLVAIQHDGDLSKIEDNTKLNSIISHEEMVLNEKYKPSYTSRINCFLFMGTNKPVKITDAKSGIIRRLIDVTPSGRKLPHKKYQAVMTQIDFELGAIAYACLKKYREMGKDYYSSYRPVDMMMQTDYFYNFIEWNSDTFKSQDGTTLEQAYAMYLTYCSDAHIEFTMNRNRFREELKNYFAKFDDRHRMDDGSRVRNYYSGFLNGSFVLGKKAEEELAKSSFSLVMDSEVSYIDEVLKDCPAQYASESGIPLKKWASVDTTLESIDTGKLHYVKVPENHIVIDFDLKGPDGAKSAELNLEAASKWPPTYSEFSKSGHGVHLHYEYAGDASNLSRIYDEGIEIKVFTGDSSLRRQLSKCNNIPVATLSGGLPLKEKKVINAEAVKSERGLRDLIERNLRKEIHPGTKPSMDFIHKILEDAYDSGLPYDVTDMRMRVMLFAANSTNQKAYCLALIPKIKFKSEVESEELEQKDDTEKVYFDVEVFPNLLVVCWKERGEGKQVVKMFNPTPNEIEGLIKRKLVGFNNRKYDNHILYARYLGYDNERLYRLSKRLISNESKNAYFAEAYNLSYTDIYDYASKKQSLKKWQIELGIHHQELGMDWDKPVPESMWPLVADYCANDVVATEAVDEARQEDFAARQILADLTGLTVNSTTQKLTAKLLFGDTQEPQKEFIYTDLSNGKKIKGGQEVGTDPVHFPGYKYDFGKSEYRGENPGEGGYVYAEPGMYTNVALLDVASMHPNSIRNLELFGPYTKKFTDLLDARIAIKHKDFDTARKLFDGKLEPYLRDESKADDLAFALKIVINIVYGLTSAKFENKFRDERNKDNVVAKRGALFMIDLKNFVQERGFTVAHIKTDSIKIPNATPEIIQEVFEFGKKYGYDFEHEATYEKMCLVNDAVYIAKVGWAEKEKKIGTWEATGTQFAVPYVHKTLFTHEPISFQDMCETKTVTTALYLDMNENLAEGEHNYQFIGRAGSFCPIKPGYGGGVLLREKDGQYHAASGTKGYRWLEAETVVVLEKQDQVDRSYYDKLVDAAIDTISKYGDFEWFVE